MENLKRCLTNLVIERGYKPVDPIPLFKGEIDVDDFVKLIAERTNYLIKESIKNATLDK